MKSDNELLESYAQDASEPAFRELVERHIGLVHAAALRESKGNVSIAEDVTQAVFTELALHAPELVRHPAISGWLYTCVRRMAANVRRAEERRQRREQEAFSMNEILNAQPSDNLWQQVRPVLDDVMHELDEEDRTAVVLRFFEGRTHKEVGLALGLTENAARMRVERSLKKLHHLLAQRGVTSTSPALIAVLAAGAVMIVPASFAATVAAGAMVTAGSTTSTAFALRKLLSAAKGKTAAAGALVVLVAALTVWLHLRSKDSTSQAGAETDSAASTQQALVAKNPVAQDDTVLLNPAALSQMILHVVDAETGAPLPDTKLHLFYLLQDGRGSTVKQVTDVDGKFGVELIQRPFRNLNMFVTANGHIPKVMSWGEGHAGMPAEYTMKMERGVTLGGVVVDETGQPVSGARIEFGVHGNNIVLEENVQFGPDTISYSDLDGRWSCDMVPTDLGPISVIATHREYAETKATIQPKAPTANNFMITMKAGFSVAGIVQDTNGNPIASAHVREARRSEEGGVSTRTEDSGAFELKTINAGELQLALQARGFAPAVKTLQISGNLSAVRFQLGPGQLLRGRVTDEAGKPIGGAWAETTRGRRKIEWSTTTRADGRFEWDSAPTEPLLYSFQAEGFNRVYALELLAAGSEHQIKLTREQPGKDTIEITGTALDAETGEPLAAFKVSLGDLAPDSAFPFRLAGLGKDGRFNLSFPAKSSYFPAYQIQIEKDGYLPSVSAEFQKKDGSRTLDFTLQKGSGPSGVVFLPNGQPAADAAVLLCTDRGGVTIDGPAHVEKGLNTTTCRTQTDAGGNFSLPAATAPEGLVFVHDQGYLELFPINSYAVGNVTLKRWGRIEGKLILDSQPVADEPIVAGNYVARYSDVGRRFMFTTFHLEATTDSAGKFSFNKVPPGRCHVFRQVGRTGFGSHDTSVVVNAGAVTEVLLGGTGRPVIGKLLLPGATQPVQWQTVAIQVTAKGDLDPGSRPNRDQYSSKQAYIAAAERFFQAARYQRPFTAFCDSNGSFRLQDVPSGTYQLEANIRDSKPDSVQANDSPGPVPQLASLIREIIVPEIPEGQTAEAVDLGVLELVPPQDRASAR